MNNKIERHVERATNKLAHKITNRLDVIVGGWIWGMAFAAFMLLAVVGIGLYLYYYEGILDKNAPVPVKEATAASWDGKSTFICDGNDSLTLSGVQATLSTTAIVASGNCKLTLEQMNITAPVVIEAGSNAKVSIKQSTLTGTTTSIDASGNSTVTSQESQISGPTKTSGLAKIR
jgi:hypothetical protein